MRYVGVSNETSLGVMEFCRLSEQKGLPKIVSIQNSYSLLVSCQLCFDSQVHNSICRGWTIHLLIGIYGVHRYLIAADGCYESTNACARKPRDCAKTGSMLRNIDDIHIELAGWLDSYRSVPACCSCKQCLLLR